MFYNAGSCIKLMLLTSVTIRHLVSTHAFKPEAHGKHNSSSSPELDSRIYSNLTNKQLAKLLRKRGFIVQEFRDSPPLVREGDRAFTPEQVLEELGEARSSYLAKSNLWLDGDTAVTRFVFDSTAVPDEKLFLKAVGTFKDGTCIQFKHLETADCQDASYKPGAPAICVGSYSGCWSKVGRINYRSGNPQKMSVMRGGCEMVALAHEFGHSLGAQHQQSRPDRDQFMTVAFENLAVKLDKSVKKTDPDDKRSPRESDYYSTCTQGELCSENAVVHPVGGIPLPYDYMSLMQYGTDDFSERSDPRPVFIAKNVAFQYMVDYHRNAGLAQTHYDYYIFNYAYKCLDKWRANCERNGKQPPKCKNFGYVGQACKCLCPPAFTGSVCERQRTPGVLYPLMKKAHVVHVDSNQLVDIGSYKFLLDKADGPLDSFKNFQFFVIAINGSNASQLASLSVARSSPLPSLLHQLQDLLLETDCKQAMRVMWGLFSRGLCRMACVSTMASNEVEGPNFRSRTNELGFYLINYVGSLFARDKPQLTVDIMTMQIDVLFSTNPSKVLTVQPKRSMLTDSNKAGGDGGDNKNSVGFSTKSKGSIIHYAPVFIIVLLVLV